MATNQYRKLRATVKKPALGPQMPVGANVLSQMPPFTGLGPRQPAPDLTDTLMAPLSQMPMGTGTLGAMAPFKGLGTPPLDPTGNMTALGGNMPVGPNVLSQMAPFKGFGTPAAPATKPGLPMTALTQGERARVGPLPADMGSSAPSGPPLPSISSLSPTLQAMMGAGAGAVSPEMIAGMTKARNRGLLRERTQEPGPMPSAGPPASAPGAARVAPGMAPYQPPGMAPTGALTPDMKAIIDDFTGKRVHKGMGGQVLGQENVSPALKYMLYAKRGRRHIGFGGKEIY